MYRFDRKTSSKTSENGYETNTNASRNDEEQRNKVRLYKIEEIPEYLRFNPHVKTGYRRHMDVKDCCRSLFFVHNETVNIYTHGLSGVLMLFWIPYASVPSIYDNIILYLLHFIGCLSPFVGSTVYHLFMCHNSGSITYDCLLMFDMCGIWAINTLGGLTAIKATLFCSPNVANILIVLYILAAFVILYFVLTANNVKGRLKHLIFFGVFRYAILVVRGIMLHKNLAAASSKAIIYYMLMDLAALIGGVLNASRFPERYFPGKLDFCFNSHNIMHVVVTFCPILLHWGTMLDFSWMANYQC